ncbi:Abi family protein [Brachybacterium sp. JHP9]|uniref:Abi family protein n=1 Tax=Brachybacterium equifaecis TaxID=2910770 RepID=A0ABT0R2Q9_9MICO|nr:Abi family protein [Brachybacterium equifaecis]MCL6424176.1 Abi family protein [Brachybacterium equifaecis]
MRYSKPHLGYEQQASLLDARGLDVGCRDQAVETLKRIGYYRLSAYTFPLRKLDPEDKDGKLRLDEFRDGACLRDAVALHDSDHRLRKALLGGLQELEVGLRTRLAYGLGKRDPFGHVNQVGLDSIRCARVDSRPGARAATFHASWIVEYQKLQKQAGREPYVQHFVSRYEGEFPIWVAAEFLTMGSLVSLYDLLEPNLSRDIAQRLKVSNQNVLYGWLRALNTLRNHCAHTARIWNRTFVFEPDKINVRMVEPSLHHLVDVDRRKLYFLATVLAYLLQTIHPDSRFRNDFVTAMKKHPSVLGLTPQSAMGFVPDWEKLEIWRIS